MRLSGLQFQLRAVNSAGETASGGPVPAELIGQIRYKYEEMRAQGAPLLIRGRYNRALGAARAIVETREPTWAQVQELRNAMDSIRSFALRHISARDERVVQLSAYIAQLDRALAQGCP